MRVAVASVLLVLLLSGCGLGAGWSSYGSDTGTATAVAMPVRESPVAEFEEFARYKSEDTWALAYFADRVYIGLADDVLVRKSAEALKEPKAWVLDSRDPYWRGSGAPYSAIEVLGGFAGDLTATHGPHMRCDEPPIKVPKAFRGYEQWSIQPAEAASCLEWFAVDVWKNPAGEVAAVTLDFREP